MRTIKKLLSDGTIIWDSPASIFPDGIQNVYKRINLPASAHNKWWDPNVAYAKQNGGSYNFIISGKYSMPQDEIFWDDLFYNATKFGLLTYEQDFLNFQTLNFPPVYTDVNFGRKWLLQMGQAAANFNLTIQYCMSLSRNVLQSLEIPTVTQVRVSSDYAQQWYAKS